MGWGPPPSPRHSEQPQLPTQRTDISLFLFLLFFPLKESSEGGQQTVRLQEWQHLATTEPPTLPVMQEGHSTGSCSRLCSIFTHRES